MSLGSLITFNDIKSIAEMSQVGRKILIATLALFNISPLKHRFWLLFQRLFCFFSSTTRFLTLLISLIFVVSCSN